MDITEISKYLVLVITAICLCIGYIIKHIIPGDKVNRYIPVIMGTLGVVLNLWLNGWAVSPEILLGGLVSGLASTGMYEAFRNFIGGSNDE